MNFELIGYLGLIGFGVYSYMQGGDKDMIFYARSVLPVVAGAALGFKNVKSQLDKIPSSKLDDVLEKHAPKEEKEEQKDEGDMLDDCVSVKEDEDYTVLMYLTKRLGRLEKDNPQKTKGETLLKELNDVFYEIHKSEAMPAA